MEYPWVRGRLRYEKGCERVKSEEAEAFGFSYLQDDSQIRSYFTCLVSSLKNHA